MAHMVGNSQRTGWYRPDPNGKIKKKNRRHLKAKEKQEFKKELKRELE